MGVEQAPVMVRVNSPVAASSFLTTVSIEGFSVSSKLNEQCAGSGSPAEWRAHTAVDSSTIATTVAFPGRWK